MDCSQEGPGNIPSLGRWAGLARGHWLFFMGLVYSGRRCQEPERSHPGMTDLGMAEATWPHLHTSHEINMMAFQARVALRVCCPKGR